MSKIKASGSISQPIYLNKFCKNYIHVFFDLDSTTVNKIKKISLLPSDEFVDSGTPKYFDLK